MKTSNKRANHINHVQNSDPKTGAVSNGIDPFSVNVMDISVALDILRLYIACNITF